MDVNLFNGWNLAQLNLLYCEINLLYFFNHFFADRKNANPVANVLWEQEAT